MTQQSPRDLSLIERAARVYDFNSALRARRPVMVVDEVAADDHPHPHPSAPDGAPSLSRERERVRQAPSPAGGRGKGPAREAGGKGEGGTSDTSSDPLADSLARAARAMEEEAAADAALAAAGIRVEAIDRARLAQAGLIVPGAPVGALAEEFRLVKRQLLLAAARLPGAKARTVLVGSAKPGDGKTYCALNLALSLAAERDLEVLLVDADFAKPDIMARLGLDAGPGLLDALADGDLDAEGLVVRTDVPHLSLLPAGTKTSQDTELLSSRRARAVVEGLLAADPRRVIVFDTPPVLGASPASVLAAEVGQVMLVVRADRTTESDVRRAVSLLDACDQISLVLNSVSFVPGGNRFGSYYGQGE